MCWCRVDLGATKLKQSSSPTRPQMASWPALKKWDRAYLARALRGHAVMVGDAPMRFEDYCAYADSQEDELPLYLFDKRFATHAPELAADYRVPEPFAEDLFSVLGDARPDHRWIIIGPSRSGSTFHQDPNATCAWNAVVSGSKKWVLYPPSVTPPGVRPSADGADVASPVSLPEWFLSFYEHKAAAGRAPAECVVRAGEILFVPRQWWHLAINLEVKEGGARGRARVRTRVRRLCSLCRMRINFQVHQSAR